MREPLCKYFNQCGGCSSQNIEYELQLENKKKNVIRLLGFQDVKVFSDKEFYYRNRMDFVFHEKGIGLRRKGTWDKVMDIESCAISNEKLNILLKELRDFFKEVDAFDIRKHTGTFRYAVIRTPSEDSSISFILNTDSMKLEEAGERIKEFAEKSSANNIVVGYVQANSDMSISEECYTIKGSEFLKEVFLGKNFKYSIQGFFQNNSKMASKMLEYSNELLRKYKTQNSYLLDLYGGVGTFGIINSELFKEVLIIENSKGSIDAANENIKDNDIQNAKAKVMDAKNIRNLGLKSPLFVITDPPRSGMHPKTIEELNKKNPELILYVSCNSEQLAKDIMKFKNYKINSVALFDLFPQTNHMEVVVELVKVNLQN